MQGIESVLKHYGYDLDTPIEYLPKKVLKVLLYGSGKEKIKFEKEMESKDGSSTWVYSAEKPTEGIINGLRRRHRQTSSDGMRRYYEQFMSDKDCSSCKGMKLQPASLGVLVGGKNIMEVSNLSVSEALEFFGNLKLSKVEQQITEQISRRSRAG
jgi:excinuclease ABC subunit A